MRQRIRDLYHYAVAVVIFARVFITDANCPFCEWHEEVNVSVRCSKHHEKQFMREGRAYHHIDQLH